MAIALGRELQWTVLNQPSRITCAMPRASFLSIFTGIVVRLRDPDAQVSKPGMNSNH
jgi:hypothetical protein